MATAKNKKAAAKKKAPAKASTKKSVKAAGAPKTVKKSSAGKPRAAKPLSKKPVKKSAPKKPAKGAKPVTRSAKSSQVAAKAKGAAAKVKVAPAKPSVKAKKPAAAPKKSSTARQKSLPVKPNGNAVKKSVTAKPKASAVKKPVDKKSASKVSAVTPVKTMVKPSPAAKKPTAVPPPQSPVKKAAPVTVKGVSASQATVKEKPAKPVKAAKPVKGNKPQSDDGEEGPDPLQLKADKVIKELEEIMDLSKMRPRIQAGSAPKPVLRHVPPPLKLIEPTHTSKQKYQLEFEFRSSPKILFTSLSDSSGLAGWFADEVKTKDDLYTFIWEGGESYAKLVAIRDLQLVRFQWLDDTDGTYFQFEIKEDDITADVALIITDFANPGEKDTNIKLWEAQVQKLRMLLGSL